MGATTPLGERILEVVASLPAGTVISYGEVAAAAGRPGAARAVGAVLACHGAHVPWWRVTSAAGRLAPGKEREQARRLALEGTVCRHGHVVSGIRERQ